jgi:hypothetical protein
LAGLFDDDDSDGDFDYESNGSTRSGCSGGVRIFRDLPVSNGDQCSIYGESTARHGDDRDGSAHRRVGNTRGPSAIAFIDTVKNCAVPVLRSRGAETPPNRPRSKTASPNPSERRREVFLEKDLIKKGANVPHEQQRRMF